ncbi:MAG: hypothetical protein JWM42_2931 [Burkholderia sp.]|jgi:hypothetical protein|nr:hypothetical protein [Burkholderia sp.]
MNLEPRNLGIPFPPRDWFWLRAVLVIFAVSGLLAWIYPDFGIPYLVTAVFALPILGPWLLSARFQQWSSSLGWGSRLLLLALVFAYLKFAKSVLVPAVLIKIGGGDV